MAKIATHIYNGSKGKCAVCGKLIRHSSHSLGNADYLAEHFKVGNVILSHYWRAYDRVVAFHPASADGYWAVEVRRCDVNGDFLPGELNREHCTSPDSRDLVITNVAE